MDQKPAIDTASLFASETFGQEGFHLVCFEVMNWGTWPAPRRLDSLNERKLFKS